MKKKVEIYTDGACSGNPGPGGWGAVLIYNDIVKNISGYCKASTNNRMELEAVIHSLNTLKKSCNVIIHTDSAYIFNAFEKKWINYWIQNGWTTKSKKKVLNTDLWERLLNASKKHAVSWVKVKGHSDDKYNNQADKLATNEIYKHTSKK